MLRHKNLIFKGLLVGRCVFSIFVFKYKTITSIVVFNALAFHKQNVFSFILAILQKSFASVQLFFSVYSVLLYLIALYVTLGSIIRSWLFLGGFNPCLIVTNDMRMIKLWEQLYFLKNRLYCLLWKCGVEVDYFNGIDVSIKSISCLVDNAKAATSNLLNLFKVRLIAWDAVQLRLKVKVELLEDIVGLQFHELLLVYS